MSFHQKDWRGLQTSQLPQTSCMTYGKGQQLKIWICFLPWSKCIHSNLNGTIMPFKQKSNIIYRPRGRVSSPKWLLLIKMVILAHFGLSGVRETLQIFPSNVFGVPLRVTKIHFVSCRFHRLYRGSEITVGSEDPLQKCTEGICL